jgi:periplasmic copper chaperone A
MRPPNDVAWPRKHGCTPKWNRCGSANRYPRALFHLPGNLEKKYRDLLFLRTRYHFEMRLFASTSRRVVLACGIGMGTMAQHASALFVVNQPWILPAQQAQATEAYMNLTSTDGASLVGVVSAAAASAAILAPGQTRGAVDRLPLPAQKVVALAPEGYRIVLRRLVHTLKVGARVPLTLTIEAADGSRQTVGVDAEVRLHSPIDDEMHAHKHAH